MTKRRKNIYLVTVVLLLPVILLCIAQMEQGTVPFCVQLEVDGKVETISLWEGEDGISYVFLPACAETVQVRIHLNTSNPVFIDEQLLTEGLSCDAFASEKTYVLRYHSWGMRKEKKVEFLRSANVPAMFVDTQSGSMEYIHEKKGNKEQGTIRLYLEDGRQNYAGTLLSIKGRGNATWTDAEKKPYSLTLYEAADLLEMGAAENWILISNGLDPSNLRNKLVYDFAQKVGMAFSPDCEWIDLYLNGEYAGLYLLCERNEIHPERVDISENGSFLVSLELEERLVAQNYPYVKTAAGQVLRIHDPDMVTAELLENLLAQWQSVENTLLADDGIDPVSGKSWLEMIDLDSWARKYLVEEIFGNFDACLISQYFYLDGGDSAGKICAGPVWDFDNALGSKITWRLLVPETFHANQYRVNQEITTPWFYHLYQKDVFYNRVVALYQEEFLLPLKQEVNEILPQKAELIVQASQMNQIRWEGECGSLQEETEYIIDYMNRRLDFLTSVWCDEGEYCFVYADWGYDCCYAVRSGECFTQAYIFPEQEYGYFDGWYYAGTDEPFDITKPVTEDIEIYTKWKAKSPNRLSQIGKMAPLGIVAVIGVWLLMVEIKRARKIR